MANVVRLGDQVVCVCVIMDVGVYNDDVSISIINVGPNDECLDDGYWS